MTINQTASVLPGRDFPDPSIGDRCIRNHLRISRQQAAMFRDINGGRCDGGQEIARFSLGYAQGAMMVALIYLGADRDVYAAASNEVTFLLRNYLRTEGAR